MCEREPFRRHVVVERVAPPIEMVGRNVEYSGGQRHDRRRPVQLKAAELDREHVKRTHSPFRPGRVPILPATAVRSPAARSIDASIIVVVVLPSVPVTTSHGGAAGLRSRHASSGSPHTSTPRLAAAANNADSRRQPGEVTTNCVPVGQRVAVTESDVDPDGSRVPSRPAAGEGRHRRRRRLPTAPSVASTRAHGRTRNADAGNAHRQFVPRRVVRGSRDPRRNYRCHVIHSA